MKLMNSDGKHLNYRELIRDVQKNISILKTTSATTSRCSWWSHGTYRPNVSFVAFRSLWSIRTCWSCRPLQSSPSRAACVARWPLLARKSRRPCMTRRSGKSNRPSSPNWSNWALLSSWSCRTLTSCCAWSSRWPRIACRTTTVITNSNSIISLC